MKVTKRGQPQSFAACPRCWADFDGEGERNDAQGDAPHEDAVSRLGKPQREEPTLRLPQPECCASQYDRVKGSGAISFLYWRTGIDGVAVLGLDAGGRGVFKFIASK
jgi:hypothetical protein